MEKKHWKKRAAAGAAGAVTAASLLVHAVSPDAATLLKPAETDTPDASHVMIVDSMPHRSYILETDQFEPYTLRERACTWLQSLPLPVKTLVLLPLWGVGEGLIDLFTLLWQSPIGQAILHFLLEIAVLAGLFLLVWKLLFPHVPLKKLLTRRNLLLLLIGAAVVTIADAVLKLVWEDWNIWRAVIMAVVGFAVVGLLTWRILQKWPLPKRRKKRVELVVQ